MTEEPPRPLLETIGNLAEFHHEYEKFYSQAPLRHAVDVQAASRVLIAAVVLGVIAAILPARRAGRLKVIEALAYE